MANEIRVVASIEVVNGNFVFPKIPQAIKKFDQAAAGGGVPGAVTLTTIWEQVDLSELTEPGWVYLLNTDTVHSVEYDREREPAGSGYGSGSGSGSGNPTEATGFGLLKPGEPALFRLGAGTLWMRALSGAPLVQVFAMED